MHILYMIFFMHKRCNQKNCDIYLELGYQSSAFSYIFISEKERKKLLPIWMASNGKDLNGIIS